MGVWEPLIFYDMKKTDDISKVVVMSFCLLKIDTSLTKKNRLKHLTNHSKKAGGDPTCG